MAREPRDHERALGAGALGENFGQGHFRAAFFERFRQFGETGLCFRRRGVPAGKFSTDVGTIAQRISYSRTLAPPREESYALWWGRLCQVG